MRRQDLEAMDFEELWLLHEELTKILAEKITAEKRELENVLRNSTSRINSVELKEGPRQEKACRRAANTRRSCRNTSIHSSRQRLGRDVVSSLAGWLPRFNRGTRWRSSGFARTATRPIGMLVVKGIPNPAQLHRCRVA